MSDKKLTGDEILIVYLVGLLFPFDSRKGPCNLSLFLLSLLMFLFAVRSSLLF